MRLYRIRARTPSMLLSCVRCQYLQNEKQNGDSSHWFGVCTIACMAPAGTVDPEWIKALGNRNLFTRPREQRSDVDLNRKPTWPLVTKLAGKRWHAYEIPTSLNENGHYFQVSICTMSTKTDKMKVSISPSSARSTSVSYQIVSSSAGLKKI